MILNPLKGLEPFKGFSTEKHNMYTRLRELKKLLKGRNDEQKSPYQRVQTQKSNKNGFYSGDASFLNSRVLSICLSLAPGLKRILAPVILLAFTLPREPSPWDFKETLKRPRSPNAIIWLLPSISGITSVSAYNTARISAPLTVLIYATRWVISSMFTSPVEMVCA